MKGISSALHLSDLDSSICRAQACHVKWEMNLTRRRLLLKGSLTAAAAAVALPFPVTAHAQSAVQRTQQEYDGYAGEQH